MDSTPQRPTIMPVGVEPMDTYSPSAFQNTDWTNTADVLEPLTGGDGAAPVTSRAECKYVRTGARWSAWAIVASGVFLLFFSFFHPLRALLQHVCAPAAVSATFGTSFLRLVAVVIALLGLLGVFATAARRNPLWAASVAAVLLTCSLVFCGTWAGAAVLHKSSTRYYSPLLPTIAFAEAREESSFAGWYSTVARAVWVGGVEAYPSTVCALQSAMECSGYGVGRCCVSATLESTLQRPSLLLSEPQPCFLIDKEGLTYDVVSKMLITWPEIVCPTNCTQANENYSTTCELPFAKVISRLSFFVAVFFFLLIVACFFYGALAMCHACCVERTANYIRFVY